MPDYLPIKMTMAQATLLRQKLDAIAEDFTRDFNLAPEVVNLELAIACARFAYNAGVLDRARLPAEALDDSGKLDHEVPNAPANPALPDHAGGGNDTAADGGEDRGAAAALLHKHLTAGYDGPKPEVDQRRHPLTKRGRGL